MVNATGFTILNHSDDKQYLFWRKVNIYFFIQRVISFLDIIVYFYVMIFISLIAIFFKCSLNTSNSICDDCDPLVICHFFRNIISRHFRVVDCMRCPWSRLRFLPTTYNIPLTPEWTNISEIKIKIKKNVPQENVFQKLRLQNDGRHIIFQCSAWSLLYLISSFFLAWVMIHCAHETNEELISLFLYCVFGIKIIYQNLWHSSHLFCPAWFYLCYRAYWSIANIIAFELQVNLIVDSFGGCFHYL